MQFGAIFLMVSLFNLKCNTLTLSQELNELLILNVGFGAKSSL